jgi:DNA modification methylase
MITNSLSKKAKELSIKPYYTNSHCTIYQGDCLDIMATFPDESIDLIITKT